MTRLFSTAVLLFVALVVCGCQNEKTDVEAYLKELHTSKDTLKAAAKEMEASMAGMQRQFADGTLDSKLVKEKLTVVVDKIKAEKTRLGAIKLPPKAKTLHDTTMQQYDVAVSVLEKTPSMVELAQKMSAVSKKVKADPKTKKPDPKAQAAAFAEMKEIQTKLMALQSEIGELGAKGRELDVAAKAQEKMLRDELGIAAEPTPAMTATPVGQVPPASGQVQALPVGGATPVPAASATP